MSKVFIRIAIVLLCISVFYGCATSSTASRGKESLFPTVRKVIPLSTLTDNLYDVNTGEVIGDFAIGVDGDVFTIEVNVGSTKGITSYDGTHDFESFSGDFKGIREDYNNVYLLKSEKNNENLYAVIYDNNNSYKSLFDKDISENENLYLLSVFNEKVYKIAFNKADDNYNPVFSIHALKPHIRTHAAILVKE